MSLIGANMTNALSAGQKLLRRFHQRHAGATSQSLGRGRTASGLSSYETLSSVAASAPPNSTILDLACGDGLLLELVHADLPDARLIGVDISPAELQAAKVRLASMEPELLLASAQELPLDDASVDVVLCHMSLMLMEDIERVVAEIGRVLTPGGVVALVVSDGSWPAGAGRIFKRLVREAVARFGGACPALGDNRTRSSAGLMALFDHATGFKSHTAPRSLKLNLDAGIDQVWESLSLMYNFEALEESARDYVRERFFETAEADLNAAGQLPYRASLLYACWNRVENSQ